VRPFKAALIFARCSADFGLPWCAARIFCFVSSVCPVTLLILPTRIQQVLPSNGRSVLHTRRAALSKPPLAVPVQYVENGTATRYQETEISRSRL
jgi:hypothetical protein